MRAQLKQIGNVFGDIWGKVSSNEPVATFFHDISNESITKLGLAILVVGVLIKKS